MHSLLHAPGCCAATGARGALIYFANGYLFQFRCCAQLGPGRGRGRGWSRSL